MKKQIKITVLISAISFLCAGCAGIGRGTKESAEAIVVVETAKDDNAMVLSGVVKTRAAKIVEQTTAVSVESIANNVNSFENISFEATDFTGYVQASSLNIRTDASTSSSVAKVLKRGDKVRVVGKSKDWYMVEVDNKTLYASSSFVSDKKPEATSSAKATAETFGEVVLNKDWKYASFSKINSGSAKLYKASSNRKDITIAVNAGHGTKGGGKVKTYSHPDKTAKVTGGTNASGAVKSTAISSGTTFLDGTTEAAVTLRMAKILKNELLARGYDVLMIRESEDVQLDNIARTVIANNTSSAHISLHWDSTTSNKGAYFMRVPNVASYKAMEPVASTWKKHNAFGEAVIGGLRNNGVKIYSSGSMEMDLTQTSYATIPSIAVELGDRASDYSEATLKKHAKGLADGISAYFGR